MTTEDRSVRDRHPGAATATGGEPGPEGSRFSPSGEFSAENRSALLRLLAVVLSGVALAVYLHGLAVLVVILALVATVMLHELGHFATAKFSGMKVTEYFLGFGPRLWSVRRGETEYGVKAIPAGGYVKIVGMTSAEEVAPEDEARSYRQASFPRRLLVAIAGSGMHFVIAFVLLWSIVSFSGLPVHTPANEITGLTTFVGTKSPAQLAGLEPGDVLVGANGRQMSINDVISFVKSHADKTITLLVRRDHQLVSVAIRPVDARGVKVAGANLSLPSGSKPVGLIGVSFDSLVGTSNPLVGVQRAGTLLGSVTASTGEGIAKVFSLHGLRDFAHQVATAHNRSASSASASSSSSSSGQSTQVLSIVGFGEIAAQAFGQNVTELLYLLALINIFLAMVNLFPMLPLDGGHVAIALYERVRSRRGRPYHADVTKLLPFAYLFLAFLLVLGIGALYSNIVNPVSLPG